MIMHVADINYNAIREQQIIKTYYDALISLRQLGLDSDTWSGKSASGNMILPHGRAFEFCSDLGFYKKKRKYHWILSNVNEGQTTVPNI